MKSYFISSSLVILLGMLFCPCHVQAQANNPGGRLSFLSADDRAHFLRLRHQVLESQPDLKAEQESLEKERKYVKDKGADATVEDKQTLRQNFMAHNEKMNAAMLQVDPSISSVLDQIKAHWKARFQQRTGDAGDNSSS